MGGVLATCQDPPDFNNIDEKASTASPFPHPHRIRGVISCIEASNLGACPEQTSFFTPEFSFYKNKNLSRVINTNSMIAGL